MLRFFKNIRQKLAAENKVVAYLRYAIGEIILVVIGILIALQINNWKENIKNNALEKNILKNIKSDLVLQQETINEQILFEDSTISKVNSADIFLSSSLSLEKLNSLLLDLTIRHTFVSNKTSYVSMNDNGEKNLIQNTKLQNEIVQYYQRLDYVTQVVNNNNLFIVSGQFSSFVSNNSLNIRLNENGSFNNNQKLSPEGRLLLKNQLSRRKEASESNLEFCLTQLKATKNLIQLIDNELD